MAASIRILVVDDDYAIADSMAVLLDLEGFNARIAHTGQEALELIPEFKPQVVLLDIGLKGMDGFETAKRLRALPEGRDLYLVALTGYSDAKTRECALESGCDNFLTKPMGWSDLSRVLAEAPL
jgi:two-component system CheB/CheR fusion protein